MKSLLMVRPVFHWKERRVRAHLLLCMLAYYVEWHMRQRLAQLLFADEREDLPGGPVSPRERSPEAKDKDRTRRSRQGGLPLQSFPDLLGSLSSLTAMEMRLEAAPEHRVRVLSALEPLQERAFELLGSSRTPPRPWSRSGPPSRNLVTRNRLETERTAVGKAGILQRSRKLIHETTTTSCRREFVAVRLTTHLLYRGSWAHTSLG